MKWDVKHDRAKKVLNHFLDNAGYWTETESLTEGLTEDEIQEVSAEVATMIQSIGIGLILTLTVWAVFSDISR